MGVTIQFDRLPLVLGLGPLSKSCKAHRSHLLLVSGLWILERFWESLQLELSQDVFVEELLDGAYARRVSLEE